MTNKFEDWLMMEHAKQNPTILDDDLPDAFNNWICFFEPDEWLHYGELYGVERALKAMDKAEKIMKGEFK